MSVEIAPSILAADFTRLAEEIAAAERGGADRLHLDVMDGRFVPNISFGPFVVAAVRRATRLPLDVHLMIEEPERYVGAFAEAGATSLTVHLEASPHLHRTVEQIRGLGCRAGVSINPGTPCEALVEVLPFIDIVLVMSVNPGFGGQRFIPTSTGKVARLRALLAAHGTEGVEIQVDGGVDASTAGELAQAGARVLIAGSSVFGGDEAVEAKLATLRAAAGA